MSTAFGVAPVTAGSKFFPTPSVVSIFDRDAPLRPRKGHWSIAEIGVLREFAGQGRLAVKKRLPHRSESAIVRKAGSLGIAVKYVRKPGYVVRAARGKIETSAVHPLVKQFFDEANRKKMTFDELGVAGFGNGTVRRWRNRHMPRLDNFIAALNLLGLDLAIIRKSTTRTP